MLFAPYVALLAAVASAESGHLKLDFKSSKNENPLSKRLGLTELSIATVPEYYEASLKIGSNNATVKVLLDTGSSDLWIMQKDADCIASDLSAGGAACSKDGVFDPKGSRTFKEMSNAPAFNITYGDGTFAAGYYGIDSVSIGSARVPQCTFAVVNSTTSEYGVFGIGLPADETGNTDTMDYNGTGFVYPNFPLLLKSTGVTLKNVYSLYLNSEEATSGSVLFGAVDHNKYSGTLQTMPLVNPYTSYFANPIEFRIMVDSVSLQGPKKSGVLTTSPFEALLDSGNTFSHLPREVVKSVGQLMLGTYNKTEGFIQVSCDYMTNTDSMIFNMAGAQISVPFSDLVVFDDSNCFLALRNAQVGEVSGKPYSILGDNFLRHAYVVYDLEDYEISLAQVKYDSTENIEVVTSTIPLAVKALAYSATSFGSYIGILSATGIIEIGSASTTFEQSATVSKSTTAPKSSSGSQSASAVKSAGASVSQSTSVAKSSSTLLIASSSSTVGTKLSSGIKSVYVTKAVLYSAVCAGLFAYF